MQSANCYNVAISIQNSSTKRAEVHVTELVEGIDYLKVSHFLCALATKRETDTPCLSKVELNQLLVLAQSDRERELVKYTAFRGSGMTRT